MHEPRLAGRRLQTLSVIAGKAVQRIAELVERQRLHMELEIGGRVIGRGFGENAELRRRHGERAAPVERIVDAHPGALRQDWKSTLSVRAPLILKIVRSCR